MTTPVSLQRMRPNWGKRIAVTLGSVVIAGLIVGLVIFRIIKSEDIKCEDIDEPSIRSPDGKWVVNSTTKACPAGPLSVTNYDVMVTLSPTPTAASAKVGPVRIFESDGSSQPPTITWASANVLVLELNDEGAVKVSKHEFANVTINYVVPKSLWDNLGKIETVRLQEDRESEELHKAGKMSSDDLRISLQINQAVAEGWTNFRQWVLENASYERGPVNDTPKPQIKIVKFPYHHLCGQYPHELEPPNVGFHCTLSPRRFATSKSN
jgi:hypothetical protein